MVNPADEGDRGNHLAQLDRYGLVLTTRSSAAAELYVEGTDRILALDAGGEDLLRAAIALDEEFAVAHAALGFLLAFTGRAEAGRQAVRTAGSALATASRRERQHVAALALALGGDREPALDLIRLHLDEFPRDALLLYQGMILTSFGGGPNPKEATFELYRSLAPAYGDDWWFLGSFSFAYHELDRFSEAWTLAERSLDINHKNASAVHSLAHLHYEADDHVGGLKLLRGWLATYDRSAPYHTHLNWHQALHELAQGHSEEVMRIYWEAMSPTVATGGTVLADASSLLWRLELYGGVGDPLPWTDLRSLAMAACDHPGAPFVDVHAALACAGSRDVTSLAILIEGLRALEGRGHPLAGSVVLPLVQAIASFAEGDYEAAIAFMEPVLHETVRVGGTHLQREVFEDTLLFAYVRAGRGDCAEDLLRRRLARRPSRRDRQWLVSTRADGQG